MGVFRSVAGFIAPVALTSMGCAVISGLDNLGEFTPVPLGATDAAGDSGDGPDSGSTSSDSGGDAGSKSDSGSSVVDSGVTPIAFVQVASFNTPGLESTVSVAYPHVQQQGDLNVVVVAWANGAPSKVSSISDSAGNSYMLAATQSDLAVFYAPKIAGAASNTVTVHYSSATGEAGIIALEYSGVSRVDQSTMSNGTGNPVSSGTVSTSTANELVFAGATSTDPNAAFQGAGAGYTQRALAVPVQILAEDMIVAQTGMYSGKAVLLADGGWVLTVVTFK